MSVFRHNFKCKCGSQGQKCSDQLGGVCKSRTLLQMLLYKMFISYRTSIFFPTGISGQQEEYLYKPGQDAILPCGSPNVDPGCQYIHWLFNRDRFSTFLEVSHSKVENSSGRADRLSLASHCSLVIKTITAEDAGLYSCRWWNSGNPFKHHHLIVLTSE